MRQVVSISLDEELVKKIDKLIPPMVSKSQFYEKLLREALKK